MIGSHTGGRGGSAVMPAHPERTRCYKNLWDYDLLYTGDNWDGVLDELKRTREQCSGFTPYEAGFTPKQHLAAQQRRMADDRNSSKSSASGSAKKRLSKQAQSIAASVFGVTFIVVLLVIAIFFPTPSPFQYTVFRIVLSLATAGVASMIPGVIEVEISDWLRAGGALAVFVVVFFYNPATLVVSENQLASMGFSTESRARVLLVGYDGAFALAKAIQGEDFSQDRARINEHLRWLEISTVEFPAHPTEPEGSAENAATFARELAGVLEARDNRLKAAFILGWFGVISTNTPSISPPGFSIERAADEAGFLYTQNTPDEAFIEELVADARSKIGS